MKYLIIYGIKPNEIAYIKFDNKEDIYTFKLLLKTFHYITKLYAK